MCGIAGIAKIEPGPPPEALLRRMTDSIAHRGPDASGYYNDAFASLGHRRLSIIDLATGGQPMTCDEGDLWITYNGEIFNHAEVRVDLERRGHRYQTRSDTETILHAYQEDGPECVQRFRGMFSFAIWDRRRRTLFCARDRLGIKPFYYFWDGGLFVFASEIKALLVHPAVSPRLEESMLPEYLAFGYLSGEKTMFAGIRKLLPGHHLLLSPEGLRMERYWDPPKGGVEEGRPEREWIAECRRRLEETVRMRLMSDVPLGVFLSGGVDSSAVAALVRRMVDGPVKTFAVGYREAPFSELDYARRAAGWIGTEHHEVNVSREDFFNALPDLIWLEDEPVTWPSSVSLYFVSRLAARHVKVVLTGEGSDELFGGYGRYRFYDLNRRWMRYYRLVPAALRRRLRETVASTGLLSASLRRKLQHSFLGLGEDLESLYLDNFYSAFSRAEQERLMRAPDGLPAATYDSFREHWQAAEGSDLLARMLYADLKTYLVELLMKQDQMSMACSIESRVPFLDHTLVEFAAGVPGRLKTRGAEGKYILKKAVEDLLPRDIVYRKKMGFPTPLRQWLEGPHSESISSMLRSREGLLGAYLDPVELDGLLEAHRSGLVDATDRIWRLLNLQLWGDIFLLGRRELWREGLTVGGEVRCGV